MIARQFLTARSSCENLISMAKNLAKTTPPTLKELEVLQGKLDKEKKKAAAREANEGQLQSC